jgi:hypothetical protein
MTSPHSFQIGPETHTKGPWELRGPTQVYGNLQRDQNSTGDRVAVTVTAADAAFIVRAFNSHYELLKAAELALELVERVQDEEGFSPSTSVPATHLRAAIAKATGGAA